MAMDGLLLFTITKQLQTYCPCKLNKIQNLSDEEIVFQLHTKNAGTVRLVCNVHSNTNRIYITQKTETSQSQPTNFVMVLRKQCAQCIIESIEQIHYDRVLCLHLQCRNELGDYTNNKLYVECMGKYANMILVNQEGIIIDALKRIPVYENAKRTIHPGATYILPKQVKKVNPTEVTKVDMDTSLVDQIYGFSPLLSKEFQYRMANGQTYQDILKELLNSQSLYVYPHEYHCIELTHLHQKADVYPLMVGLDHLYQANEQQIRIKEQCGDVFRTVDKELKKAKKKLPKLQASLEKSYDYKKYQQYGDLLFAYMHQIKKEKVVHVPDFETGQDVSIPIDMRLDIKGNANKYYQKYHKMKRSQSILQEQIETCKKEIDYFEQLHEQLQHCTVMDALEIRQELVNAHVMMHKRSRKQAKHKNKPNVLHLQVENVDIYVGKNNLQNNYITHHLSRKKDIWFHVKDYHGSHVLCKCEQPNEALIRMCAMLAAYYSKGQMSSSVPVDYCPVSQLKKVPGAPVGFVTMKSYKTIYIDPDREQIEKWIRKYKK